MKTLGQEDPVAECSCLMMSPLLPLWLSTLVLLSCLQPYGMSHPQQLPGFLPALNVPKAISWHRAL